MRGKEIEALRADSLHERAAATGQDDYAIVRVRPDRMKQIDKLLVGMSIEDQRSSVSVKRHFQDAALGTRHRREQQRDGLCADHPPVRVRTR